MAKYDPLRDVLNSMSTRDRQRLTFAAIDELVGGLPNSAHRHRAWWANDPTHIQASAWLEGGRVVEEVDQAAGWVCFSARHLGGEFDAFWKPLRREEVPDRGVPWYQVWEFALAFDGYAYARGAHTLGEEANRAAAVWSVNTELPTDVNALRACLFFEQRRYHHYGTDPEGSDAEYVWALVEGIRAQSPSSPNS